MGRFVEARGQVERLKKRVVPDPDPDPDPNRDRDRHGMAQIHHPSQSIQTHPRIPFPHPTNPIQLTAMASTPSTALQEEASFPMGYRFEPTDEEIAHYYLHGFPSPTPLAKAVHVIAVDFDACQPWSLIDSYSLQRIDKCYFLTYRRHGGHPKSKDKHGIWTPNGTKKDILDASGDRVCALYKPYKYFKLFDGKRKEETDYKMKEYCIVEPGHLDKRQNREFQRVLCVIEKKKSGDHANLMPDQHLNQRDGGDQPPMLQRANRDTISDLDLAIGYTISDLDFAQFCNEDGGGEIDMLQGATGDPLHLDTFPDLNLRATQVSAEDSFQRDGGDQPPMLHRANRDTIPDLDHAIGYTFSDLDLAQFYNEDGLLTGLLDIGPSFPTRMDHHLLDPSSSMPMSQYPSMAEVRATHRDGGDELDMLQDATGDALFFDTFPDLNLCATQVSGHDFFQRDVGDKSLMLQDAIGPASHLETFSDLERFSYMDGYYHNLLAMMHKPHMHPSSTGMDHDLPNSSLSASVDRDCTQWMEEETRPPSPRTPLDGNSIYQWVEEFTRSPSRASDHAASLSICHNIEELTDIGGKEGRGIQQSILEEDSLPIGVRFSPTDEEIILYFLMKLPCIQPHAIHEVNVYDYDPWTLQSMYSMRRVRESYFITNLARKYALGSRPKRTTDNGVWKSVDGCRPIKDKCGNPVGGVVRTLVYKSNGREKQKIDWIMKEYRLGETGEKKLSESDKKNLNPLMLDDVVVCKLYKKKPGDR